MTGRHSRRRFLATAGAVASTVGLAGCASVVEQIPGSGPSAASDPTEPKVPLHASEQTTEAGIDLAGKPIMGSLDAPVTIYYWGEYLCPFCKRFEENTFPLLVKNYVAPGTVRVVLLEFPHIGERSMLASVVGKCVWRQVKAENPYAYRRWHKAIFEAQEKPGSGWAKKENLLTITRDVEGVDADAVDSCVEERRDELAALVRTESQAAKQRGLTATPGFLFHDPAAGNSKTLTGAQPYERFESIIESVHGQ